MSTSSPYSKALALPKMTLLYICTCGLYFLYWFYRSMRLLSEKHELNKKAGWYTAGLLVPLLNLFLIWGLFKDIRDRCGSAGQPGLRHAGWLTLAFIGCTLLYQCPGVYCLLGFFSILPLLYAQMAMNAYWLREEGPKPLREEFNWFEILISILGVMLLAKSMLSP